MFSDFPYNGTRPTSEETQANAPKAQYHVPLLIIAAIACLTMSCVIVLQMFTQRDIYLVDKYFLGYDYLNVYRASELVREGRSPYAFARYVVPPVPAILNVPLSLIPFEAASVVAAVLLFLSVVASLFLLHRMFKVPSGQNNLLTHLTTLIILCFSYPFFFLLDRGNVDGFVLLFICLGLYCLARRHDVLCGSLFALAVSFKVYPALLVLPLVATRRWKVLATVGLVLAALFLLMPYGWIEFVLQRIAMRTSMFRTDENASIASTFFYLGASLGQPQFFMRLSYFVYALLLGSLCYLDARTTIADERQLCAVVAMYLPFMVAVPQLSYHYELVMVLGMIPVVCWLWARATKPRARMSLLLMVYGIGLSQFQALAMAKLTGAKAVHFIPGFGLFLVMIGAVAYRWHELRKDTPFSPAGQT